eukprot:12765595-Alexandrium_andersonii.AAC.1
MMTHIGDAAMAMTTMASARYLRQWQPQHQNTRPRQQQFRGANHEKQSNQTTAAAAAAAAATAMTA